MQEKLEKCLSVDEHSKNPIFANVISTVFYGHRICCVNIVDAPKDFFFHFSKAPFIVLSVIDFL